MLKSDSIESVHFIEPGKSYLPELDAYTEFFTMRGIEVSRHKLIDTVPSNASVIWVICGSAPAIPSRFKKELIVVHEYASASVGCLAFLKDKLKCLIHPKPTYRVFLNEWVERQFNFKDDISSFLRDMGVPHYFFTIEPSDKRFDYIYIGETSRLLAFRDELSALSLAGKSLVIIGSYSKKLEKLVSTLPNVELLGRKNQSDIPYFLSKAKAGLNLMPLQRPYVYQTATKVYEYLAAGLPVVSNSYKWIDTLSNEHEEAILVKNKLNSPECWNAVENELLNHHAGKGRFEKYSWQTQMSSFGLLQALNLKS